MNPAEETLFLPILDSGAGMVLGGLFDAAKYESTGRNLFTEQSFIDKHTCNLDHTTVNAEYVPVRGAQAPNASTRYSFEVHDDESSNISKLADPKFRIKFSSSTSVYISVEIQVHVREDSHGN